MMFKCKLKTSGFGGQERESLACADLSGRWIGVGVNTFNFKYTL